MIGPGDDWPSDWLRPTLAHLGLWALFSSYVAAVLGYLVGSEKDEALCCMQRPWLVNGLSDGWAIVRPDSLHILAPPVL
jgi:hypothetical protein